MPILLFRFSRKAQSMNTAVRLRSAMRRARLQYLPRVPVDLLELHEVLTHPKYRYLTRTLSGKSYMYRGMCGSAEDKSLSLIFMSKKMESALRTAKKIFCDSSWDGRPAQPKSSQVFSMTTTWDHQVWTSVFVTSHFVRQCQ